MNVAYSSGYTSFVTSPPFTKPVNDLKEFIKQNLFWAELGSELTTDFEQFIGNPDELKEFAKRGHLENSTEERWHNIHSGNYAYFTKVLSHNFVTDFPWHKNYSVPLRIMKQCVHKYFSAIVFPKNSPYTDYFSYKLKKYIIY